MKHSRRILIILLLVIGLFSSCKTAADRSRSRLSEGDYVGAIEELAPALTKKPADKEAGAIFRQIHPSYAESLLTSISQLQATAPTDTADADRLVDSYDQLVRIQRAVVAMPAMIGDKRRGFYAVKKYEENFPEALLNAQRVAAGAWYAKGDSQYPGGSAVEKESILNYFLKAEEHVPNFKDTRERLARLGYDIAEDYEMKATIPDLRKSVEWLQFVKRWADNYHDTNGKLQMLSFRLGTLLKAEGTAPDYREAYTYFKLAGNYDNASAEVQLYEFYDKISKLPNEDRSSNGSRLGTSSSSQGLRIAVGRSAANPDNPFERISPIQSETTSLSLFRGSSDSIHIGAVIDGASILDQNFRPIIANRLPLRISGELANGRSLGSVMVEDPGRQTSGQSAIQQLLGQAGPAPGTAELRLRMEEISSREQLELALGFGPGRQDLRVPNIRAFGDPNLSATLVEISHLYYTINADLPNSAVDFYATRGNNIVSPALLRQTAPYYVSQIAYGRRAWFLIESTQSSQRIQEELNRLQQPGSERNASDLFGLGLQLLQYLSQPRQTTNIHTLAVTGGSANPASLQDMVDWIQTGMDLGGNLARAVPVGFTLRSLKDNRMATITQESRIVTPGRVRLTMKPIVYMMEFGSASQLQLRVFLSGGELRPELTSLYPNLDRDGNGWILAYTTGTGALIQEAGTLGLHKPLEGARSYTTILTGMDDPLFVAALAHNPAVGYTISASAGNPFANFEAARLRASDLINRTSSYRQLRTEGLILRGQDFQCRVFFEFELEPID